jgi:thioredoxin-like negative regulator of GroEL
METDTADRPVALETRAEFDEFVAAHDRALVEFYTDGCSICASMDPVLSAVARQSDAAVATVNPRNDPELIDEYDVRSVPMLLLFEDGHLVDTVADGFLSVDEVLGFVGDAA